MSLPKISWENLTGDCPIVSELEKYFRAENKSGIATCLAQLKSDPKLRKEFTKHANNLFILAQLLRCQNHTILNMSLSILADVCIAFEAREKVCFFSYFYFGSIFIIAKLMHIRDVVRTFILRAYECDFFSNYLKFKEPVIFMIFFYLIQYRKCNKYNMINYYF